ncbi:hypothetical protein E2986_13932 [Frieseomelitta varia]|uniref:Cytochrome P450 n=1 Tax=Frieseomelitta varia TaxID=561572 RepID=A0A833WFU7_9HYME|nr:hypothetical protein E2986_13932 [Frieseomelitta varia]
MFVYVIHSPLRHNGLPANRFVAGGSARCSLLLYHEESQFVQEAWNRAHSANAAVWKHGIARQTTNYHAGFACQDLLTGFQSEIHTGFYEFLTPVIVLRDLDLIKAVTIKNVEQFPDHRSLVNTKVDPIIRGMLFMNDEQWKDHRNLLSPTSSKIKTMFKLMSKCTIRFAEHLSNLSEEQRETEMKDLLTKYTNDAIASCVYNVSSVKEPNNVFYVCSKICTSLTAFKRSLIFVVYRNTPWLAELLQLKIVDSHIAKFFYNQVAETVEITDRRSQAGHSAAVHGQ